MRFVARFGSIAVVGALIAPESIAFAAIHQVPLEHPTIQAAIDAASLGDTVDVAAGVFSGAGNHSLDFGGKGLLVRGSAGPGGTVLNGLGAPFGVRFDEDDGPEARLRNLSITNAVTAIAVGGGSPRIEDCRLFGNGVGSAPGDAAVYAQGGAPQFRRCWIEDNACLGIFAFQTDVTLETCVLARNRGSLIGGGIYLRQSTGRLTDCLLAQNSAAVGGGIALLAADDLRLTNCTIAENQAERGGGIAIIAGTSLTLERTIVWGNCAELAGPDAWSETGDWGSSLEFVCSCFDPSRFALSPAVDVTYQGVQVLSDPLFCRPVGCDAPPFPQPSFALSPDSPCAAAFSPCGQLIGAESVGCDLPALVEGVTNSAPRFVVSPNPARLDESVHADLPPGKSSWRLIDPAGRAVASGSVNVNADGGSVRTLLWTGGCLGRLVRSGTYWLQVEGPSGNASARITLRR